MRGSFSGSGALTQFFLLIFLALGGLVMFSVIGLLLGSVLYGFSLSGLATGEAGLDQFSLPALRFLQGMNSLGGFLLPAWLGAYLISPRPVLFLRIDRLPAPLILVAVLVVLTMLSGGVLSDLLYRFSQSLPWPEAWEGVRAYLDEQEWTTRQQVERFMQMDTPWDLATTLVLLAVLPAVCEEAFFRGALQPVLQRLTGSRQGGLWLTAFLFALIHLQFYAFLSILLLGAMLGYLRQWSQSLWLPVLAHFVNNATIVLLGYFGEQSYGEVSDISDTLPPAATVMGLAVCAMSWWSLRGLLRRRFRRA